MKAIYLLFSFINLLIFSENKEIMDYTKEIKNTEDWWDAEKYHQNSGQQLMVALELLKFYKFKETDHVLDVGCGDGKISNIIAGKVSEGQIVGVDPSVSMLTFANQNYSRRNLSFLNSRASNLKFKSQFDVITSFSALHWEPNQKKTLLNFKNALKKGGTILLAIPGPDETLHKILKDICNSIEWGHFFDHYESKGTIWSSEEYEKMLNETGFIIQRLEIVENRYYFSNMKEYIDFISSMIPHVSCIPKGKKDNFLEEIKKKLIESSYIDSQGRVEFKVNVLEVIAILP